MLCLDERTVKECYVAKHKENGKFHVGRRNQTGFGKIGDLKRSITYEYDRQVDKPYDMFDFYKVDSENMTLTRV